MCVIIKIILNSGMRGGVEEKVGGSQVSGVVYSKQLGYGLQQATGIAPCKTGNGWKGSQVFGRTCRNVYVSSHY